MQQAGAVRWRLIDQITDEWMLDLYDLEVAVVERRGRTMQNEFIEAEFS
jgi:hypothetical protein